MIERTGVRECVIRVKLKTIINLREHIGIGANG